MTRDEKLEKISTLLWNKTHEDWELRLSHTLTEPTCPTAIIKCERKDSSFMYWRSDADTIEEAIDQVVDICYAYLFENNQSTGTSWSEPTLKRL